MKAAKSHLELLLISKAFAMPLLSEALIPPYASLSLNSGPSPSAVSDPSSPSVTGGVLVGGGISFQEQIRPFHVHREPNGIT